MKKLNETIYNKLLLQAEEAKFQNLNKLASAVINSLGPVPEDEDMKYNYSDLQNDIYQDLWKAATCVIKYHDVDSADIQRIHDTLHSFASKFINELETSLSVDNSKIGPLEDKVPGESE